MSSKKRKTPVRRSSRRKRLGILTALALACAFLAAFVVPAASPVGSATAPPEAAAGTVPATVWNYSGSRVEIDCNWKKGPYYMLYEKKIAEADGIYGKQWISTNFCKDPDRIQSVGDGRCMQYKGLGAKDGWYYLPANTWKKIKSLSKTKVYAYSKSRCSKSKVFPNIKE